MLSGPMADANFNWDMYGKRFREGMGKRIRLSDGTWLNPKEIDWNGGFPVLKGNRRDLSGEQAVMEYMRQHQSDLDNEAIGSLRNRFGLK